MTLAWYSARATLEMVIVAGLRMRSLTSSLIGMDLVRGYKALTPKQPTLTHGLTQQTSWVVIRDVPRSPLSRPLRPRRLPE